MPDLAGLVADPRFAQLPPERQRALAADLEPRIAGLPPDRQDAFLADLAKPKGETSSSTTTTVATAAKTAQPGLLGTAYKRGILEPAAEINALGWKYGVPGAVHPQEFRRTRIEAGIPGSAKLSTEPLPSGGATGAISTVGALTSPLEMTVLPLFGLGTGVEYLSGSQKLADALEGVAGVGMLGREVARARFRASKLTPNELRYNEIERNAVSARDASKVAETRMQAAEQAHQAAARDVETAETGLRDVTGNLRQRFGVDAGTPTPERVGEQLRAIGENAANYSPTPGGRVGVAAQLKDIRSERRQLYAARDTLAEQAQLTLPKDSAHHLAIREQALQYFKRVRKGGTQAEKELANTAAHLGEVGLRDPLSGELFAFADAEAKMMEQLKTINPRMETVLEDVPFKTLSDLDTAMARIALRPRDYPITSQKAGQEFYRLRRTVDEAVRTLEVSHPDVADAGQRARAYVRDIEDPMRQTGRAVLAKSVTPTMAYRKTFGTAQDATHAERIFMHAKTPGEREGYAMARLGEVFQLAERDAEAKGLPKGSIDFNRVVYHYSRIPKRLRLLISSVDGGRAETALHDIIAGKTTVAAQRGVLEEADRSLTEALKEAAKSQKDAKAAEEAQAFGRKLRVGGPNVMQAQHTPVRIGVYFLLAGPAQFAHGVKSGSPFMMGLGGAHSLIGASWLYGLLKRPQLVTAALKTRADTANGRVIAAALHAALQGYRGTALQPSQATLAEGSTPTPSQRPTVPSPMDLGPLGLRPVP